ncbi:MAG: helix-turn-helix domain-containing protein [Shewanella oncorhynchi]
MDIYVVTENNFFFIALKEGLPFNSKKINKILPDELENTSMERFNEDDIFIFHTVNFGIELSFLVSTGNFPGKSIFIPTTSKESFKLAFNQHVFLDTYATVDDIARKIRENSNEGCNDRKVIKDALTRQEKLILRHTINGMNAQSISRYLSISIKTVYSHRRKALHKLGGRNLFEIWPFRGKFIRDAMI